MIAPIAPIMVVQLQGLLSSPPINLNAISSFALVAGSGSVAVTFTLADNTGVDSLSLYRAAVMDAAQATVIQTWSPAPELNYSFLDSAGLSAATTAFYWIQLNPQGTSGTPVLVGPQQLDLNPDLAQPDAPTGISLSHSSAKNGVVTVYANVSGVAQGNSLQVFVTGYEGNTYPVAISSSPSSPVSFTLQATGETVTVNAKAVSPSGVYSTLSPSATITLNSAQTVAAAPNAPLITQFAGGNQLSWKSSPEPWVTSYLVYRGQRGGTYLTATMLATVAATSEGTVNYTDTTGLGGDYAYYLVATSASGNSAFSGAGTPTILYSSASIPPNVASNTTNNATVDSVDAGMGPLVRVYGPGGPGTSYARLTGYGTLTRPNGTISGLSYSTKYGIMWTGSMFSAVTSYPATLPDDYEIVGTLTTTAATGTTGTGATAVAVIGSGGTVVQVNPTNAGSGYVTASVNFSGGGGSDAQATANVVSGGVTSYTVTNGGSGYTSAPLVTIVGGSAAGVPGGGGPTGGSGGGRTGLNLE